MLFFTKAIVLILPTIESSFVNHTTKSIEGFDHPESPALVVALEALNAAESFLWVKFIYISVGDVPNTIIYSVPSADPGATLHERRKGANIDRPFGHEPPRGAVQGSTRIP